ncbi:tetracycline resistance MFS efflux pump [Jeotgalicoccus sp. ATCC 8456]|uniref:MFS transporter n=2 Tax=Staphylococcaceae TaxID=90964 RepID=UPI000420B1B6|nr:tetracycline resistance MFS efflux pump [Jeotgalicoccus sp. ATCC 8456]QQD84289.1 tetracycline resistance MFS efflux pump [Jeotgalicoccus sp. ATCC 8456]
MKQLISVIMIIQFLIYFGFSMIIPVIPELVNQLGVSTLHMGLLLAIYSLASFLSAPFFGRLSDKIGRRPLLIGGLSTFAFSFLIFGLFIDNLPILYISRIIGGAASGALYTATTSMVADITTREERTKYMGLIGMCIGFGFIFGPGVGGLLAGISLSFTYYMTTVVILGALVFSLIKVPETYKRQTNVAPKKIGLTIDYFTQPIGILLVGTFFVMFFMSGMESTFQLLGQERINITPTEMGVLFFIGGIFNALTQGVFIRRIKDGDEKMPMVIGQVMAVVAFIMLPFMTGLVYAGICIVLLMTGNALVKTLMTSLITKEASQDDMGRVTATTYSLDSLGRICGPLVFNALFLFTPGIPFYFGALMTIFSTHFIFQYYKKRRRLA